MPTTSLRYSFRQPFPVAAPTAYAWCTDFGPEDGPLFSHPTRRSVRHLAPDALVLTDFTGRPPNVRRIRRLVRTDGKELAWTNTHLDGPFRHSQYWYRVVPDGPRRSHLEFTGLRLVTVDRSLPPAEVARRAEEERRHDAREWREFLAPALERDCRGAPARPRRAPKDPAA